MGDSITTIFVGLKAAVIFVLFIILLVSVRSISRPMPFSAGGQTIYQILNIGALGAYLILLGVTPNEVIILVAAIAGLVIGFLIGGMSKVFVEDGRILLKRSFLAPTILMFAYLASTSLNLFATKNLMAAGVLFVVLAAAMVTGSAALETIRGQKLAQAESPA